MPSAVEQLRAAKALETWPVADIVSALRKPEKRVLRAMVDGAWHSTFEFQTNGGLLWELSDFRRDERGIAPPIMLVTWDYDEMDGRPIRLWQITREGKEVARAIADVEQSEVQDA